MGIFTKNLLSSCSVFCKIFFIILFTCQFNSSIAMNNETDRLALLDLKAKFHDPLGVMNSWNDAVHICQWYGVTCGRRNQRVAALQLQSCELGGSISPFIGNLSFLVDLELYNNSLVGEIPFEISRLHRLQYLLLHNNSIEGQIPSNISSCSNLIQLRVPNNKLVGRIPIELGYMPNLQFLSLDNNHLSGSIPASLGNLSSLSKLSITDIGLVGSIPDSLGKVKTLTVLSLFNNLLSGTVPSSIFNLSKLVGLDLGFNNFQGNLPSDIGITLPNLRIFYAGNNGFTGSIPASISNSSNLEQLQLDDIGLTGKVPSLQNLQNLFRLSIGGNFLGSGRADDLGFISTLTNATSLETFSIGDNRFGGMFPKVFCNFSTTLRLLKMGYNTFTGHIPPCLGDLVNLLVFSVRFNKLSGNITPQLGKLQKLGSLFLNHNHFSGNIPSSLGNITQLTLLDLSENKLQGCIPLALGNCQNLLQFSLYRNDLNGSIPPQLLSLPLSAYNIILSSNHLTGALPAEVGSLKNLVKLEISDNMLTGEIPSSLGECFGLQDLFMEGNLFQGAIPLSLSSLKGLQQLDLSNNNLSGGIPVFLASFPLQKLNLSYNNLEGEVPVNGSFSNSSVVSLLGNRKLCGGISELKLPECNFKRDRQRKSKHRQKLVIAVLFESLGAIMLVSFLLALIYIVRYKKKTKLPTPLGTFSENYPNLSYQTLLKATNGFSLDNLIGRGTFGAVYKGILDDLEPSVVAIKIFNLEQHGASKSFMAECGVLRTIRHRNLVKVITACSSVDYQGNDFKALVYEYMVSGSLEDWLHPVANDVVEDTDTAPRLSLRQKLDIVVDVASALEYLHHHCGAPIIHCDLKPSNVLLDEELVAHIGDFGLAKFLSENIGSSNANPSSSLGVRGTVGYAPPEYGLGNEPSTNGDVYSFGILLLEMFTGRRPTNDIFSEGISLHQYVKEALPERVIEILDHALVKDVDSEKTDSSLALEILTSVLGIALCCSTEVPQERLGMIDVTAKLSSIRNKLLGS
ncbi:probable LRR receptor-like serine/threonine-protein kinase At3g47570 [Chenopodium quinoa]|uniref:non-specific serine/threonine protein kinase n=1 Tax=Chenopodium quinoa TaxID=63459 RepID=A0A803LP07_CHEQI|nr:probable LRR receptor-like serine/threonine-protein kinase At3g47570 [Chenopodium quinoa]